MRQSAISSASLSACWMLCTFASMFTTTPRLRPWLADTPRPASLSSPVACTSATTTMILAVPMSRPTTKSLYSLAMIVFCSAGLRRFLVVVFGHRGDALHTQRVTIGVTQIHGLQRTGVALRELAQGGGEAAGALEQVLGAATTEL